MRRTILFLFLFLFILIPITAGSADFNRITEAGELESFFDGLIPALMEDDHIAGSVISIVYEGEEVFSSGYGYADIERQEEIMPGTTGFRIGSISKLFIWISLLQLQEQGLLSLDDQISSYLPFELTNPYDTPITIHHLMTHTAGFEDRTYGMWPPTYEELIPFGEWLADHIPTVIYEPGAQAAYSNFGAAAAALIVERVSGIDYDTYVEKNILSILGLDDTTLRQDPVSVSSDLSEGYLFHGGRYQAQPFEYLAPSPAGSGTSTASDMALFMLALLDEQAGQILSEDSMRLLESGTFYHDDRLKSGIAHGMYEQYEHGYRIVGHGGDTMYFHSRMALFPDHDLAIFTATNSIGGTEFGTDVVSAFLDEFSPAVEEAVISAEPSSGLRIDGTYRMNRLSLSGPEKLYQILADIRVTQEEDGCILLNGPKGPESYLPIGDGMYRKYLDDDRILLTEKDGKMRLFIESVPVIAFSKVPWYGSRSFSLFLLINAILVSICCLVKGFITVIGRKRLRREVLIRMVSQTVWSVGTLVLIVGLAASLSDMLAIQHGTIPGIDILLLIPYLLTLLAGILLIEEVVFWREWKQKLYERIWNGWVVITSAGLVYFLIYWKLLGGSL